MPTPKERKPTPQLIHAIVSYIRAGSFPQVAAEAAGLPGELFETWMERGKQPDAPLPFRNFRQAIRKAQAEVRLTVEIELRKSKPLDWLRHGPGKPGDLGDGWTQPARAAPRGDPLEDVDLLTLPQMQQVIAAILDVLAPHPELCEAVAQSLRNLSSPASSPGA
jgi:hypothetical protein